MLTTELFADDWKVAVLRLLLKRYGLERIDVKYRLVSNLPFISKIVEKCGMDQFKEHCIINDLTPQDQLAYKKDHSCETVLVKVVNDALWAMDKGSITLLVIMDLSAAFDSVNHNVLLSVLEDYFAVGGAALGWFRLYQLGEVLRWTSVKNIPQLNS